MHKRVLVMRHAKSSWKSGALDDHERPLNKRGRRDAPRVAAHLTGLGWVPELVLSSTSQRTRETFARMEEVFEPPPEVRFLRELYLAGPREVEDALKELPREVQCVMVLGHNEGWEEVVSWLSGAEERLTTANAALLSLPGSGPETSWEDAVGAAPGWRLEQVVRPKELEDSLDATAPD